MSTNNFPGVGPTVHGRDYNFYQKATVTATSFGASSISGVQPDMVITFQTQTILLLNENTMGVVEYSFNGNAVHGELDPTLPSRGMTFDDRVVSKIWFRVKTGSSGPITVRVDAYGIR